MILNDFKAKRNESGFTIIELMIATTIFSLVLMICLAGVLQITKMYYRGVTQNNTREVARSITDEIGEAIRFSSQAIVLGPAVIGPQINDLSGTTPDTSYFCIGNKRYSYAIDRQVKSEPVANTKQQKHALWVDTLGGCSGPLNLDDDNPSVDGRDLIPQNMRLYELSIKKLGVSDIYEISAGVAYGDNDLLSARPENLPTELTCEGAFVGSEFCATTNLRVTVQKRL